MNCAGTEILNVKMQGQCWSSTVQDLVGDLNACTKKTAKKEEENDRKANC
jgi:hypothetical protein